MLKNKKIKYVLHIFTFLLVFFVCGNVDAYTISNSKNCRNQNNAMLECTYRSSDGKYQYRVWFCTGGEAFGHYDLWNGSDPNDKNDGEDVVAWDDWGTYTNWDWRLYTNYNSSTKKGCPLYVLGKKNSSSLEPLMITDDSSYTKDGYQKVALSNSTFYHANMGNPRESSMAFFANSYNLTTWSNPETEAISYVERIGGSTDGVGFSSNIKPDKEYKLYVAQYTGSILAPANYIIRNHMSCWSENTEVVKSVTIDTSHSQVNPWYERLTIKTGKSGQATVVCRHLKNYAYGASYTPNSQNGYIDAMITVTVSGENDANTTYTNKNTRCQYTLNLDNQNFAKLYSFTENYNDGKNYNADNSDYYSDGKMKTTMQIESPAGTPISISYNTAFSNYKKHPSYNKNIKLAFYESDFHYSMINNSRICPEIYVTNENNFIKVSLTKPSSSTKSYTTITANTYTQSSTQATNRANAGYDIYYTSSYWNSAGFGGVKNTTNDSCSIKVKYPGGSGPYDVDTTFEFYKYDNGLTGTSKKYTLELYDESGNPMSGASSTGPVYSSSSINGVLAKSVSGKSVTFDTSAVRKVFDIYDDCTSLDVSSNFCTYKTSGNQYYVTTDFNLCDTDENANTNMDDFQQGSSGDGQTGSSGNSDSLNNWNVSETERGIELFCSDMFGPEGSRNKVGSLVEKIITLIRIGVPIILVVTTMVDFTKAAGNDEVLQKVKKNAVIRFIVAVVVLMGPTLVNLILDIIGWDSCKIF